MDGLRRSEEGEGRYYDFIYYDRILTAAECVMYELDYLGEVDNGRDY